VTGLLAADWLRLRRRRALQAIVLAIPLLAGAFFLLSFRSTDLQLYFDEPTERQALMDQFLQDGFSQADAQAQVDDQIAQEKASYEQEQASEDRTRATYAFPASITTLLGGATAIYLFALLLLTATTIGDEFSWGTIRTSLLASSNRRRWLGVRLGLVGLTAVIALAVLVVLALVLPLAIVAVVGHLPQPPPVDAAALGVLLGGLAVTAFVLIGFAAAATVVMRSGGLTLVITLVWVLAESAVLALIARLEPFRPENAFGDGKPAGPLAWALDLFPVHAFQDFLSTATQATGGVVNYGGDITTVPLSGTYLPLASLAAWAVLFIAIAVLRFDRMDIAE